MVVTSTGLSCGLRVDPGYEDVGTGKLWNNCVGKRYFPTSFGAGTQAPEKLSELTSNPGQAAVGFQQDPQQPAFVFGCVEESFCVVIVRCQGTQAGQAG